MLGVVILIIGRHVVKWHDLYSMAVVARLNVFVDVDDNVVICWYVGDIWVVGLQP